MAIKDKRLNPRMTCCLSIEKRLLFYNTNDVKKKIFFRYQCYSDIYLSKSNNLSPFKNEKILSSWHATKYMYDYNVIYKYVESNIYKFVYN